MTAAVSEFVSASDVAAVLGKSTRTVTGWCDAELVSGAKKTPGKRGCWLIPRAWLGHYQPAASATSEGTEARP